MLSQEWKVFFLSLHYYSELCSDCSRWMNLSHHNCHFVSFCDLPASLRNEIV